MHRNVARHLPRRRQLRSVPDSNLPTVHQHRYTSTISQEEDRNDDPSTTADEIAKTRALLRTLDQQTLLETKDAINTHITNLEALKPTLFPHLPSTIPGTVTSKANPKESSTHISATATPYTVAPHLSHINALPTLTSAVIKELKHVREHLTDLQNEDYDVPGDGMRAWKEEIAGMTRKERELRLENMVLEGEAEFIRLKEGAEKNAEVAMGLARERGVHVEDLRVKGTMVVGEGRKVKGEGGREAVKARGEGREKEKAKVEEGEAKPNEEEPLETSLSELQKRLSADGGGRK